MEALRAASARLADATAAQSFERAGALLGEYAAALEAAIEGAAPAAKRAAVSEAAALLAGLRRLALARRAHLAVRFDELDRLSPYLKGVRRPRRRLQAEG